MNTLSRTVTAQFFSSPDEYLALRRHWSALVNSPRKHELTAAHHLLYLALVGRDWRKGFTPPSNPRKLADGAFTGWAFFQALATVQHRVDVAGFLAPFEGHVTADMLAYVRALLPALRPSALRAEDFARGAWSFDAYRLPEAAPAATQAETERPHA